MLTVLAKYGKLNSGVAGQVTPIFQTIFQNAPPNKPFPRLPPIPKSQLTSASKFYVARNNATEVDDSHSEFKRAGDVGFENSYYDDEGWWALGWIAAWELTGTIGYLNEAIYIWNDMHEAWGRPACGGLYWNKGSNSPVNAIEVGKWTTFNPSCYDEYLLIISFKSYTFTSQPQSQTMLEAT